MSLHDSLTGLANRSFFAERLEQVVNAASKSQQRVAVVEIDLDRFKEINDLKGHAAGDRILATLGERLARRKGDGEFIARAGGDEFLALKTYCEAPELLSFINRLYQDLTEPLSVDADRIQLDAHLGVTVGPDDATTPEKLLDNASLALRNAKGPGGRAVSRYDRSMGDRMRTDRELAREVREGIMAGQFVLHYQELRASGCREVMGYEALARWQHPVRGLMPPAQFIAVAEQNGLIGALGDWVLHAACREAAAWPNEHRVAVNLSPIQLAAPDLDGRIAAVLNETGLPAHRLELEITETALISDRQRALKVMTLLKNMGVQLALDDFGTGYSSLDILRSFPFDKIKIDRTFVAELEGNPQAQAFVRAIVTLGHSLSMRVLAEGVETEAQLQLIEAEGCDELQGYYFGKPKPL